MNWLCKLGLHSWDYDSPNRRLVSGGLFGKERFIYLLGHKERCRRKQCRRVRKVEAVVS